MPQPKPRKVGRPKLPKGDAKGRIVQVRFNANDLKRIESAAKQRRSKVASNGEPRALGPLAAVKRIFAGHAFAPAVQPVAMRGEQQDAPAGGAPKTRLKELDERQVNLAERDGVNLHSVICARVTPSALCVRARL